ncbi:MAG: hypothetical protein HY916_08385 [Desulfovibrio sp.]|nr:hypothetical protein [Desulfovibrio sp.]
MSEEIKDIVNTAVSEIKSQYESELNTFREGYSEISSKSKELEEKLEDSLASAAEKQSLISNNLQEIEKIKAEADKAKAEIQSFSQRLFSGTESDPSISKKILELQEEAGKRHKSIVDLYGELFERVEMHKLVLEVGEESPDPDLPVYQDKKTGKDYVLQRVEVPGLLKVLQQSIEQFNDMIVRSQDKFEQNQGGWDLEYHSLKAKIEDLLPAATSAGLASAYETAKLEHKASSDRWSLYFSIAIGMMVLIPLVTLVCDLFNDSTSVSVTYDVIIRKMIRLLPFELPVLWFAYIATCRAKEHFDFTKNTFINGQ